MITTRAFRQDDYHNFMEFYREMYIINQNQDCWLPARWEYASNFVNKFFISLGYESWDSKINIWEENNKIVGIAQIEDTNCAFLQIRPGYYHLTEDMVIWLEQNGSMVNKETGERELVIFSREDNTELNRILKTRDYTRGESFSYMSKMRLDGEFYLKLPDGYKIKDMTTCLDYYKRYNVIRKAFNPNFEEISCDSELPDFFKDMINAPMYMPKLDLVVEDKDSNVVAACTIWYDEELNIGMVEPVGTHPAYHGKGLGKAVVREGLRRLSELNADYAYVESFGESRYKFYSSIGFESFNKDYPWSLKIK